MEVCTICHGGCCRRYNPEIAGIDILRISKTLKVDANFFVSAVPINDERLNEYLGKHPLFIFTDSGQEIYYRLCMKPIESVCYPGTSKCVFLLEWRAEYLGSETLKGVIGRCGIYSIRPQNCRSYPAKYLPDKIETVIRDPYLLMEKEHSLPEDTPAYRLCPRTLTEKDFTPYSDSLANDAAVNEYERDFFRKLSDKWNKNPDISDRFYLFLEKEYSNRITHILE
jgi:Fe-S-cluster containining protein